MTDIASRPPKALRRRGIDTDDDDEDGGITELEKFDPDRVDGVSQPANGFPVLLMKGLGNGGDLAAEEDGMQASIAKDADAKPDDKAPEVGPGGDDVDGSGDSHGDDATAKQEQDAARAEREKEHTDDNRAAEEAASAAPNRDTAEAIKAASDAYTVTHREYLAAEPGLKGADSATELLKARSDWNRWNTLGKDEGLDGTEDGRRRWITKRLDVLAEAGDAAAAVPAEGDSAPAADETPEAWSYPADDLAKESRDFDAGRRKELASEGHALPDGSYPIPDKDALRRAAILARSGHGNVEGAKRLIGRRAKELGVANPLDSGSDSAAKADSGDSDPKMDGAKTGKPMCSTCKGSGKIKDGNLTCPACKGKGKMKRKDAAAKAVRDVTEQALADGLITPQAADEILAQIADITEKAAGPGARPLPSSVEHAGMHREPDGTTTVEQLEPEAGLGTDPDPKADKVPASVAAMGKAEAPYVVKRMHDMYCAAYTTKGVLEEYPSLAGPADAAVPAWFADQAAKAAAGGDTTAAADLAALVKAAEVITTFEPAAVLDGRAMLAKSFTDMYPNLHISPKDTPKPGSYQRPYLSSGHAAESAGSWTVNIPPSTRTPDADDYQRGYLTEGHATPSPGDHGPNNPSGHDVRQYYSTSQKDMAMAAMRSMHDHIQATFGGMCPMAPSMSVLPPGMGATSTPGTSAPPDQGGISTVGKSAVDETALRAAAALLAEENTRKARKKARRQQLADLEKAVTDRLAGNADPAAIQNLIAEQVTALAERYDTQIAGLRKELDELGKQPDPAMAPVRGQMARRPAEGTAAPVAKRSLVDEARQQQATARAADEARFAAYMRMQATSDDPKVRERAEAILSKTDGVPA